MSQSHRHHYVPEWYQRRFMLTGQSEYHRLNLNPKIIEKPDGGLVQIEKELITKGPGGFFFEEDLYTTEYFGKKNVDIETYLFGQIDTKGSLALPALVSKNWMSELHPHIINFFEYMDAQRLRTPKGLHWILALLKPKDYNALLMHMQTIRQMHSTMWIEAKMEIVSAEDSDIKFIVADTPVTTYNADCDLDSRQCKFPYEPQIELIGTRTIFPIDLNYCVVLTNIEYIKDPTNTDRMKNRTNPRYHDDTIINYNDILRGRKLERDDVLGINYILKNRATKYIAAAKEEWLYPEKYLSNTNWKYLDDIFISDKLTSSPSNGKIWVGGKDGKLLMTQDEFGRKPQTQEEWGKEEKMAQDMEQHVKKLLAEKRDKKVRRRKTS